MGVRDRLNFSLVVYSDLEPRLTRAAHLSSFMISKWNACPRATLKILRLKFLPLNSKSCQAALTNLFINEESKLWWLGVFRLCEQQLWTYFRTAFSRNWWRLGALFVHQAECTLGPFSNSTVLQIAGQVAYNCVVTRPHSSEELSITCGLALIAQLTL